MYIFLNIIYRLPPLMVLSHRDTITRLSISDPKSLAEPCSPIRLILREHRVDPSSACDSFSSLEGIVCLP